MTTSSHLTQGNGTTSSDTENEIRMKMMARRLA